MANITIGQGDCPAPFLQFSNFPFRSGFEASRLCAPVPSLHGPINCCLPCPLTDWVYPDNFRRLTSVANWLNVGSLTCCVLLLLSFALLPVQRTHRHYLTVCMIIGVGLMSLSFIIPLGSKPSQCYDAITPNDMFSDLSCAFSGSLVVAGGFAAVTWVFLRSLSLHVQICWQVVPGRKFFIGSLLVGWGVPAISLALVLSLTGVSYRFGNTCHINHDLSVQTFWGPILGFAGAATILQFVTLGYCIRVYIRSLLQSDESTQGSELPSYHSSIRTTVTARAAYRRIKKVIALQWRGVIIVLIIIVDVVFFTVVFIKMDNTTETETRDLDKIEPWLVCLILSRGDKDSCLDKASSLVLREGIVMAVLYLLSLNGYWSFLLLGRWSMVEAWLDRLRQPFNRSNEFVSRDARRISDPRNYEMLTSPQQIYQPKTADDSKKGPDVNVRSHRTFSVTSQEEDYFGSDAKFVSPSISFSKPIPPSRSASAAARHGSSNGQDRTNSPRSHYPSSPPLGMVRIGSLSGRGRSGSALGLDRIGSPTGQNRIGSALSHHRAGSSLGRDWDPSSTYARPSNGPLPEERSSAQVREWDPIRTHAGAGEYIAQNWATSGQSF